MPFGKIDRYGIVPTDLHRQEMPDFLNRYIDWRFEAEASKVRRPNPQERIIVRKRALAPIERHSRHGCHGLGSSGNPFSTIFFRAIITPSRKPIKKRSHPTGRSVLRRFKIA